MCFEENYVYLNDFCHKQELILSHCLNDLDLIEAGKTPVYNIDFAFLYVNLFKYTKNMPGVKRSISESKNAENILNRILNASVKQSNYKLAISGPTYLEFLDQLQHRYGMLIEKYNLAKSGKSINLQDIFSINCGEIKNDLFTSKMHDPVKKLIAHLDSGRMNTLGDLLREPSEKEVRSATDIYYKNLKDHKATRLPKEIDRPEEDSVFHYKMDALNECISLMYANEQDVVPLYVSNQALNLRHCRDGNNILGRLIYIPLYMKNADWLLHDKRHILSQKDFIFNAYIQIMIMKDNLMKLRENDSIPGCLRTMYRTYIRDYHIFLENTVDDVNINSIRNDIPEDIVEIQNNPEMAKNIIENAIDNVKEGATYVAEYAIKYEFPFFDYLDLADDPILQKIQKNFSLKFKKT